VKNTGKIYGIHLLNDISGSPLVFSMVLSDYVKQGLNVQLYTSNSKGFLSDIAGVQYHHLPYSWSPKKIVTLINFLYVQLYLFISLLVKLKKNDSVHVNTLLPFGALLAAKIRGVHTIQHMHEVSVKPASLFRFLCFVSEHCTREMIFVSHYLKTCFQFKKPIQRVIHNRLDTQFLAEVKKHGKVTPTGPFTVLMLCSLKEYKGVYVFTRLAVDFPNVRFRLMLNASEADIQEFIKNEKPSLNCEILSPTRNTHQVYQQADLVLNLSLPNQWIETFGMTILEAKAYGIKVIAPPVGGPAEIVSVPEDGWLIDSRDYNTLKLKMQELTANLSRLPFDVNAISTATSTHSNA